MRQSLQHPLERFKDSGFYSILFSSEECSFLILAGSLLGTKRPNRQTDQATLFQIMCVTGHPSADTMSI